VRLSGLLFALVVLASPAAWAQSAEQLREAERIAAIGWELYEHDQAAWHGTDAMLADVRDPRAEGFQGWITERTPDGVQVLFLRADGANVSAAYRATFRDGAVRERGRVNQPLSEAQARINRARELAISSQLPQQCAERYNSVTLPRSEPAPDGVDVDVYLMPAQATANEAPFGGHFRFAVDTSAGIVREVQRFTNGCITLPIERGSTALWISQVIGDAPTEVHVFESLTVGKPVFVSTRSGNWSVDGRHVRFFSDPPAGSSAPARPDKPA
jgi:hypothetical protein